MGRALLRQPICPEISGDLSRAPLLEADEDQALAEIEESELLFEIIRQPNKRHPMKNINWFQRFILALTFTALVITGSSTTAADIRANAGTTFTLLPSANPNVLDHTVDGIVQVTFGGNTAADGSYLFHADVIATLPASADQPIALTGSFLLTSADGASTLKALVEGEVSTDPINPALANFQYRVTITGGSGRLAATRGRARIEGVGLFTAATAGTATWTMKGQVTGPDREQE